MKTRSPLATLPKPSPRRQLKRDVRRYQQQGGRITQLGSNTARGLCSINLKTIELLSGYACEL